MVISNYSIYPTSVVGRVFEHSMLRKVLTTASKATAWPKYRVGKKADHKETVFIRDAAGKNNTEEFFRCSFKPLFVAVRGNFVRWCCHWVTHEACREAPMSHIWVTSCPVRHQRGVMPRILSQAAAKSSSADTMQVFAE